MAKCMVMVRNKSEGVQVTGSYHRPAISEAHVNIGQLRPWPFVEVNGNGRAYVRIAKFKLAVPPLTAVLVEMNMYND